MEIGAYVRGLAHRWWVVVVIAVLAAGVTALAERNTGDSYRASVDITVPASQSSTSGANGQYVENFMVALTTSSVVDAVSRSTGVSTSALKSGLAAQQLGNSSFVSVTYSAATRTRAEQVARVATQATADLLATPSLRTARSVLATAQDAVTSAENQQTSAQSGLDGFAATHGNNDPNLLNRSDLAALSRLQTSRQESAARGESTAGFDKAIKRLRAGIAALAPDIRTFNALTQKLDRAQLSVTDAQMRVSSAASDLAAAEAPALIDAPTSTRISASSVILKAVLIAAGIGFVLGCALVFLLEAFSARRRDTGDGATATEEAAVAAAEPVAAVPAAAEPVAAEPVATVPAATVPAAQPPEPVAVVPEAPVEEATPEPEVAAEPEPEPEAEVATEPEVAAEPAVAAEPEAEPEAAGGAHRAGVADDETGSVPIDTVPQEPEPEKSEPEASDQPTVQSADTVAEAGTEAETDAATEAGTEATATKTAGGQNGSAPRQPGGASNTKRRRTRQRPSGSRR